MGRLVNLYLRAGMLVDFVTAWLVNVSAHPDHIGHPFF